MFTTSLLWTKAPMNRKTTSSDAPPIAAERIVVEKGRLACTVIIRDSRYRYAWNELARFVSEHHPDLALHSCVNAHEQRFATIMAETSVPHLLEHVAIDVQAHHAQRGEAFVGSSEWTDEARGRALIQLSFVDDLEALQAFKEALAFLNDALITCQKTNGDASNGNEPVTDS